MEEEEDEEDEADEGGDEENEEEEKRNEELRRDWKAGERREEFGATTRERKCGREKGRMTGDDAVEREREEWRKRGQKAMKKD